MRFWYLSHMQKKTLVNNHNDVSNRARGPLQERFLHYSYYYMQALKSLVSLHMYRLAQVFIA